MRTRPFAAAVLAAGLTLTAVAADKNAEASKKALQEVGDFIGQWNGAVESKAGGKASIWKEVYEFGWKFDKKTGDAWIAMDVKGGKFLTGGNLKYDAEKKQYVLTATTPDKDEVVYAGKLTKGALVLDSKDKNGDVRRLKINTLSDGARMMVQGEVQQGGKGLFSTEYKVAAGKEGESFAGGGKKKNECVVTGGLGTMAVSFGGKTYYVCCSGCREEFDANPKKYVDEYEKNKKK